MEIGISTATFFGKDVTENAFDNLRALNVKVTEVFLNTFFEYKPSFGNMLAERKENIKVHSMHAHTNSFEPELFNDVDRTRLDSVQILKKVLRTGKKLGAKFYTFHGATRLKKRDYNFDYPVLGKKVEGINSIMNDYGITLCYENVHWAYFSEPEFFEKLKPYAPNIGCCFDNKQARQSGIDYKEFLKVMNGRLKTVHVSDFDENGKMCVPGKGKFDFVELFKILSDMNFQGCVLIELYGNDYKNIFDLKDGIEYLNEIKYKLNIN